SPLGNLQRLRVHLADHAFARKFREPDVSLLVELDAIGRARFGKLRKFFLLRIEAQQDGSARPDVAGAIETNRIDTPEADGVRAAPGFRIVIPWLAERGLILREFVGLGIEFSDFA